MDGTTLAAPRTRKPRGQGHARPGEILAAARRLFAEEGFDRATMRRIAASVGVSPTALYVYFPDKEAILRAIAEETFEQLLAALEASQDQELPPLLRFRNGLITYVRFGLSRPDEYRLIFTARTPDPCRSGEIVAADLSFAILERHVAELQQLGLFVPGDPLLRAEAIWAGLHGLTTLLLDRPTDLESDADALTDTLIDMMIAGLRVI